MDEVTGSHEPYFFPAQTKRLHRLGKVLILANNQYRPDHDSSTPLPRQPLLPSPQPQKHSPTPPAAGVGEQGIKIPPPACLPLAFLPSLRMSLSGTTRGKSGPPGIPPAGNGSRSVPEKALSQQECRGCCPRDGSACLRNSSQPRRVSTSGKHQARQQEEGRCSQSQLIQLARDRQVHPGLAR